MRVDQILEDQMLHAHVSMNLNFAYNSAGQSEQVIVHLCLRTYINLNISCLGCCLT